MAAAGRGGVLACMVKYVVQHTSDMGCPVGVFCLTVGSVDVKMLG